MTATMTNPWGDWITSSNKSENFNVFKSLKFSFDDADLFDVTKEYDLLARIQGIDSSNFD